MTRTFAVSLLAVPLLLHSGTALAADDPLEPFNRAMFNFNSAVVDHVIGPLSGVAQAWIPLGVRQASRNAYANLTEPEFIVTNLLQGNAADAGRSLGRLAINSTIGIGGLFDPATSMGFERRETEFGEAVCTAGVPPGSYVVVPLVGPANVTSIAALTGFVAAEWYVLSLVSTWLAAADAVIDLSISAATLRHANDRVDAVNIDPYVVQRTEYLDYLKRGCHAGSASGGGS